MHRDEESQHVLMDQSISDAQQTSAVDQIDSDKHSDVESANSTPDSPAVPMDQPINLTAVVGLVDSETRNVGESKNVISTATTVVAVESRVAVSATKRRRKDQERVAHYREKYPLLPPCKDSCRNKCQEKITEEHRALINQTIWGLNFAGRRGWFDAYITISDVKQRTTGAVGAHAKRKHSLTYRLPLPAAGTDIVVCKEMFMHTVGLKTDGMITEYVKAKVMSPDKAISPTTEGRGHHEPPNKIDRSVIREHINSYHPVVSHYKVTHAPLRRYLQPGLTISSMWREFCETKQKVSFELYRQVFESERITFGESSQDECESCLAYKQHCDESSSMDDHDSQACKVCIDGRARERAYKTALIEYQKEIPPEFTVYTVILD
ncbi:uncharacterized protein LOC133539160 isoform X2 [Nerophis ophidion]|uniref:uncharacterized protein LOC133539160 isoform X2 n=1 Tax=Nerophis ophidion TaxID=159077 RepID=UPI002ADF44B5|nr:uncharacterized protein LOC133539160 isoform X2 [Nerophis ophidion]